MTIGLIVSKIDTCRDQMYETSDHSEIDYSLLKM